MRANRSGRPLRLLLALVVAVLAPMAGEGGGTAQAGISAPCAVGDTLTRYGNPPDWYRSVLDTNLRLRRSYAPQDLVPVSRVGVRGGGSLRRFAITDLGAMYRAAKRAGAPFEVTSAYRSYATQTAVFWSWVRKSSLRQALLTSARPGHSEHQLGTALDLKTPGGSEPWYHRDWGSTAAGAWLRRNSWRYGFVLSYPKADSPRSTCYAYEPWHFRYVGRRIAAEIRASGLAPRDWLWKHGGTTSWTGGLPNASPAPTATPEPTDSPGPTSTPEPTVEPTPGPTVEPTPEPTATVEPTPNPTP